MFDFPQLIIKAEKTNIASNNAIFIEMSLYCFYTFYGESRFLRADESINFI